MEQKKKLKYEKPEIKELGRAGDDEMKAAGTCIPAGSGDIGFCVDGNNAGDKCSDGNSPGGECWVGPSDSF
jgi:hypothetical protein